MNSHGERAGAVSRFQITDRVVRKMRGPDVKSHDFILLVVVWQSTMSDIMTNRRWSHYHHQTLRMSQVSFQPLN
jgi:hypothetical protein